MYQEKENQEIYYDSNDLKKIGKFLEEELLRFTKVFSNKKENNFNNAPPLYYLSYLFRNKIKHKFAGYLGSIFQTKIKSENTVYCDSRVGSYKYDNTSNGNLKSFTDKENQNEYHVMPLEINEDAFRFCLWRLTDYSYREAVKQFYARKSSELEFLNLYPKLNSRVAPVNKNNIVFNYNNLTKIDKDYWCYLIRKAGKVIKKYHQIKDSWFEFFCEQTQSLFIDSQGQKILRQNEIFELRIHLWLLQKNGEAYSQDLNLIEGDLSNLPNEKEFMELVVERINFLFAISNASRLNSFSGPILLSPIPSGVFFHEVIGHRLEGSRLLSPDDGATFLNLKGKQITPDFIDIIDDPLLKSFDNRKLIGHYKYDDEGFTAKKVVLVEKGILKNFLTNSTPIPKQKLHNGHSRNQDIQRPISRMSNLIINNHKPVPDIELKSLLINEIKKQKKPFGVFIKEVLGGETGTDAYDFQAFKGEILNAVKVYPNGKEELIKGVDFVGTPLSALDAVVCLGENKILSNSFCGAESGLIPVSTISPAMLLSNLELQSVERERFTQYALPLPY